MDKKDNKKTIELVIVIVGVVGLLFALKTNLSKISGVVVRTKAAALPFLGQTGGKTLLEVPKAEEKKEVKKLEWGRDPFVLKEGPAGKGPQALKLMGITTGDSRTKAMAVIDNEIVSVGSKIGSYKVTQITPNKVIVSDGEKEVVLTME